MQKNKNKQIEGLDYGRGFTIKDHNLTGCAGGEDGECIHPLCPQIRDNEPEASGRHCPLPHWTELRE